MRKVEGETLAQKMAAVKTVVAQGMNRHERRKQEALAKAANEKLQMQRRCY